MEKILKTFNGEPISQFKNNLSGVTAQVSFERLLPHLKNAIALKSNEEIRGIEIDDRGIKVYIKNI